MVPPMEQLITMATAESATGTPGWAMGTLIRSLYMVVFCVLFGLPALYLLGGDPIAHGLAWLLLVNLGLLTASNLDTETLEDSFSIAEALQEATREEMFIFIATLMLVITGAISIHVGVIAVSAAVIWPLLPHTAAAGLGLLVGVLGASVLDAWLGRTTGVSLGAAGIYVGTLFARMLALGVSARSAFVTVPAVSAREAFIGGPQPPRVG